MIAHNINKVDDFMMITNKEKWKQRRFHSDDAIKRYASKSSEAMDADIIGCPCVLTSPVLPDVLKYHLRQPVRFL